MKKILHIILTLTLILGLSTSSFAQEETGSIVGTIQDKNLKYIEGVQVTIVGTEKVCISDTTGLFYFPDLEPGSYTLHFYLNGYKNKEMAVIVPKGQTRTFNVTLETETNSTNMAGGDILYVTNLGTSRNSTYDPNNSPWGDPGNPPETYQSGINVDISILYGFDPVTDSYKNANDFLMSRPPPEDLNTFIQYAFKKTNNLMEINSVTRGAVSIIENWAPSVMPQWVDMNDEGELFVADSGSNITVINTQANNAVMTTLHMGDAIWDIAVGNSGTRLFCALGNGTSPSVGVIDTKTNSFVTTIPLPRMKDGSIGQPWGIGTHRNGSTAYVTLGKDTGGEVIFINTQNNTVKGSVTVGQNPFGLDVTPDGKKVYVANQNSGNVSVIDVSMSKVIATVQVDYSPTRVAITPDGKKALVTNKGKDTLSIIDTTTDTLYNTIPVGKEPVGIAISRDGKRAYVVNSKSDDVSIIDLEKNAVINTTIPFPGGSPYDIVVK